MSASALAEAIGSQPDVLRAALELELSAALARLDGCERLWLIGTGTSRHAAELGALAMRGLGLDARASSAATFARWEAPPGGRDGVVVISHTGETAFARTVRARALGAGAPLVSVTGHGVGWEEAIEAAPRERSETYTQSYTAALVVLARLARGLAGRPGLDGELRAAPERVRAALAAPLELEPPERLLVLAGPGPFAVTAREGALKLREAARVPAEGYEAEDLLHGHAVPLDGRDRLLLVGPEADPDAFTAALGEAAAAAGVPVSALPAPAVPDPLLAQLEPTVRLQDLARRLAESRGHDPDTVIAGPWAAASLWSRGAPADPRGDR